MGCRLVAIGVMLAGSSLLARTVVVHAAHGDAADGNPGTPAAPLRTIGAAAETARAGDTVVVKAGIYRESVRLRHSGTAARPIVFQADPPGSVVVTGLDPMTGWRRMPGSPPIYRIDWPYQFAINHIDGKAVEHHPAGNPRWGRAEQVIVDGRIVPIALNLDALQRAWNERDAAVPAGVARGTVGQRGVPDVLTTPSWPGLFAVDTTIKALYLWLADGSSPAVHTVEAATRSQVFGVNQWQQQEGVSHVHVSGFVFYGGASFPQRGIVTLHGHDNLVEDCLIDAGSGGGLTVSGSVRRSVIQRCGQVGGGAVGDGFTIQDTVVQDNCWKPISRQWDAGGTKICRAHGGTVRGCTYRRNGGPGLWFDIDVKDIEVTESVFMDNEGTGLFIEISRDFHVHHNLFLRNASGSVLCGKWHDWGDSGLKVAESLNCVVEYNTCVGNKDGITLREQGPRPLDTPDRGTIPYHNRDHVIRHNLCADNRGFQIGLWYDNAYFGMHPSQVAKYEGEPPPYEEWVKTVDRELYDPRTVNLVIDSNRYAPAAGQGLFLFGCPWRERSRPLADLAAVREVTGFEAHGRRAAVRFAGTRTDDYRLVDSTETVGWGDVPADVRAWTGKRLSPWIREYVKERP